MTVGRTWGVVLTGLHGDLVEVEADLSNQTLGDRRRADALLTHA